uniref:Reverse transcriptase zinc-binding domain-containing protein n=1 Tax=Lactuca sativa TaxID=4236 RepID=A0A9R1XWR1_LACSA|nr:hypothetical protein LSAT_V11C200090550 [Lactuca sativa]
MLKTQQTCGLKMKHSKLHFQTFTNWKKRKNPVNSTPTSKVDRLNEIPIKVLCFVWRASLGRILAATELAKRGMVLESNICRLCRIDDETPDHILIRWCNLPNTQFNTVGDIINYAANWGHCPKKRKILTCICYGTF